MKTLFNPSQFTTTAVKPLPVFLLLDTSGSMHGEKIAALNRAVRELVAAFAKDRHAESDITIAIITFGDIARLYLRPTPASKTTWPDVVAGGGTPLGGALKLVKSLVEDKNITQSRAYRPTIVLVSDGQPTDAWEEPLQAFINVGRSAKCDRMAMCIGADANKKVLGRFIAGTPHQLCYAENADQIHRFFQLVTLSVSLRAASKNPNEVRASNARAGHATLPAAQFSIALQCVNERCCHQNPAMARFCRNCGTGLPARDGAMGGAL